MTREIREPGRRTAWILAIVVHVLFFGLLFFGVSWHKKQQEPVEVALWDKLPPVNPQPTSKAEPPPKAEPPRAKPKPTPPKPAETKPREQRIKPDIALKEKHEKERKLLEEKLKREEKQKLEQVRKEEEKQKREEEKLALQEKKLKEAEQKRAQQEKDEAARQAQQQQAAAQSLKNEYVDKIRSKIRRYIVLPSDLAGNPQAVYKVILLPGGDVLSTQLIHSSGNSAYDAAIERAIKRAEPLPIPPDPTLFAGFRELDLKFRPHEEY